MVKVAIAPKLLGSAIAASWNVLKAALAVHAVVAELALVAWSALVAWLAFAAEGTCASVASLTSPPVIELFRTLCARDRVPTDLRRGNRVLFQLLGADAVLRQLDRGVARPPSATVRGMHATTMAGAGR
jgi:hypothetical protein